jgi:hypothetical protein
VWINHGKNQIKFARPYSKYYFLLMSELARLVEVASNVLGVPEKTVRSRVMLLRKNSLWSSIGKGISADPAPSDASNLLLSFLGGGLVTETADTVRLLRNCLYVAPIKSATLPPISLFAKFAQNHTLGDMLDALFTQWSEDGPPVSLDSNLSFSTVTLAVDRYSHGWDIEFLFRLQPNPLATQDTTYDETADPTIRGDFAVFTEPQRSRWLVEYEYFPELLAATNKKRARAAQCMAGTPGDLVTSARVTERTFAALADCLSQPTHHASRPSHSLPNRLLNRLRN